MNCRHLGIMLLAICVPLASSSRADTTGTTGLGAAHQNVQPSLGTNYIIALQGIYPSQSGGGGGSGQEPFLGGVALFAGNFAPRGWALARGQLLPINQNAALFSLLGTTYGGNGTTTFALPDLRGRVPIGAGQGLGLTDRQLGAKVGVESVTLTDTQLPSHSHSLPTLGGSTGTSGGGMPHEEMQPSLALNYIIARQGVFPPRSGAGGGSGLDPFVGEVALFAGNFAPNGWSFANGQVLPINQNTALFALLGTTYGGNGTTTFALPDLRGRAAMGFGQGPGMSDRELGQSVGAESVALTTAELPPHSHSLPGVGGSTGLTGGGAAHSNIQPSLGLNYIIALDGIYPPQSGAGGGSGADPYIGEIAMFAGNFAPYGWAFAQGQLLPISQNEALFSLLGTTYGGNGMTTFALPDLRGRLAMGFGQGIGLTDRQLGEQIGVESVALTVSELPIHSHTFEIPLPGDFNHDGSVDAADYVLWRKGDLPQGDYPTWRANFGASAGVGSAEASPSRDAVPEPDATALCLLGLAGAAVRRYRRRGSCR